MVSYNNVFHSSCYPMMDHKQQPSGANLVYTNDYSSGNNLTDLTSNNEAKNINGVNYNMRESLPQNNEINDFVGTSNSSISKDVPPPPKRPLTPYMRFSKFMWQQVKSDNPGLSVCEIGSTIGRMWRELSSEEKQKHNDDFTLDKVRYDSELKQYLKNTGLKSRDLVKVRSKAKATNKAARKTIYSPPTYLKMGNYLEPNSSETQNTTNLGQSFFPLGTPFNMPMGMLSGFSQMWLRQQYPNQQLLASMHLTQPQEFYNSEIFSSPLLTPGINLPSPDHF